MNILPIIRNQQLKEQRLREAQHLMAKAYRGVPYVEATPSFSVRPKAAVKTYRGISYSG